MLERLTRNVLPILIFISNREKRIEEDQEPSLELPQAYCMG
jgi:hypothetical protein